MERSKEHQCDECGTTFTEFKNLTRHKKNKHQVPSKKPKEEVKEVTPSVNEQMEKLLLIIAQQQKMIDQLSQQKAQEAIKFIGKISLQNIREKCQNAPEFQPIHPITIFKNYISQTEKNEFVLEKPALFISLMQNGELAKKIGDIIADSYENVDKTLQNVWVTDVARKKFVMRMRQGNELVWLEDSCGDLFLKKVISRCMLLIDLALWEKINQLSDMNSKELREKTESIAKSIRSPLSFGEVEDFIDVLAEIKSVDFKSNVLQQVANRLSK